jgi:hypothetical protein
VRFAVGDEALRVLDTEHDPSAFPALDDSDGSVGAAPPGELGAGPEQWARVGAGRSPSGGRQTAQPGGWQRGVDVGRCLRGTFSHVVKCGGRAPP